MSYATQPLNDPIADEFRQIGNRWGHFLALGIMLIVLGTLAILFSFIASLAVALTFGILLAASGVVQIGTAFWASQWRGFFVQLLIGLLYLIAGGFMIRHPLGTVLAITLVMAFAYMIGGAMRIAFGITHRVVGAGWVLLNGVISLILGLWIWLQWPTDSLFVVGLFVGIDLVFLGWSWVMLGTALKPARAPSGTSEPRP